MKCASLSDREASNWDTTVHKAYCFVFAIFYCGDNKGHSKIEDDKGKKGKTISVTGQEDL
jgi:hypothetical protein